MGPKTLVLLLRLLHYSIPLQLAVPYNVHPNPTLTIKADIVTLNPDLP